MDIDDTDENRLRLVELLLADEDVAEIRLSVQGTDIFFAEVLFDNGNACFEVGFCFPIGPRTRKD